MVRDGENGFLLPFAARGHEYAEVIASVYHNDERYARLVRTSRAAYEERLNWDIWGKTMQAILSKVAGAGMDYVNSPEPGDQPGEQPPISLHRIESQRS